MMRIFIGTLFLISVLLIAVPISHISSQSGIIVNNATTLRTINTGAPSTNFDIQSRIAVQYGNSLRYLSVGSIPSPLQALIGGVAQRASVQYANNIRHISMAAMPSNFQALVSNISARISFQYANSNRQLLLSYPRALLNDTAAPAISNIVGNSSGVITWNTNEFTSYIIRYGTQSGNYTETIEQPLYDKQHALTLPNLISAATYYFQIASTDISGNQSVSIEGNFTFDPDPTPIPPSPSVFLPLVRR